MANANREIRLSLRTARREEQLQAVVNAVDLYMNCAPNSHLGDCSRREDMRSAFFLIRNGVEAGMSIEGAAGRVEDIAYSYQDM